MTRAEWLQRKLGRPLPLTWQELFMLSDDDYTGEWRDRISESYWMLFRPFMDDPSDLTKEYLENLDSAFENQVFAVAADGRGHEWIEMPSGAQPELLIPPAEERPESHAERKILQAMRAFQPQAATPPPPTQSSQPQPASGDTRQARPAWQGGRVNTLFLFVTSSPCQECSQALWQGLGTYYDRLVVAFGAYYCEGRYMNDRRSQERKGRDAAGGGGPYFMPSRNFRDAMREGFIELYKAQWLGPPSQFIADELPRDLLQVINQQLESQQERGERPEVTVRVEEQRGNRTTIRRTTFYTTRTIDHHYCVQRLFSR